MLLILYVKGRIKYLPFSFCIVGTTAEILRILINHTFLKERLIMHGSLELFITMVQNHGKRSV